MTNTFRYATILALGTAVFSGVNSFLTKSAVTVVKDPILFTTLKNSIVALLLVGLILVAKKWPEIKTLTKQQWLKLVAVGVIGGSIPFALFFSGLAQTSAVSATLIHKTLFVWVLLFSYPFLKERLAKWQWVGILTVFAGNFFIGGLQDFSFGKGELMVLGATILWAIENIIAKKALQDLSSLTVASARMVFGSAVLFGIVLWQGNISMLSGLSSDQILWTLLTSALLLGYVLTWYTALKYAPATYIATLLVPATLITNVLSAVFVTHSMTGSRIVNAMCYVVGVALMIFFAHRAAKQLPSGTSLLSHASHKA